MLKLDAIFKDNMILQRQMPCNICGNADSGALVRVVIESKDIDVSCKADSDGRFKVVLPAMESDELSLSEGFKVIVTSGDSEIVLSNIKVGEVFFAGGQSNMEWELGNTLRNKEVFAELAEDKMLADNIRLYYTVKAPYINDEYQKMIDENCWMDMNAEDAHMVSAVGYYSAHKLYQELKCPIGIINCNYGGTSASCYLTTEELESTDIGRRYINYYAELVGDKTDDEYDQELRDYLDSVNEYEERLNQVKREAMEAGVTLSADDTKAKAGEFPWPPPVGRKSPYRPGGLGETMIANTISCTMRAFWWYQGEEDAPRYPMYKDILKQLIESVRYKNRADLPVILMQLPMWAEKDNPEPSVGWPFIRIIQSEVAKEMPNVTYIPLCDLGEFDNIHPLDKKTPGERLAMHTLGTALAKDIEVAPMEIEEVKVVSENLDELEVSAENIELSDSASQNKTSMVFELIFKNSGEYLNVNTNPMGVEPNIVRYDSADGTLLKGFDILLAGGEIVSPDDATIEGNRVYLKLGKPSDTVTSINYAMRDYMEPNLYNEYHFPLAPFAYELEMK